jgi:hypothetical protein
MQVSKLQVDELTVDSFPTHPQFEQPEDDPAAFMIADCTGCVSGCGIYAQQL